MNTEKRNTKPFWNVVALMICLLSMQVTGMIIISRMTNDIVSAQFARTVLLQLFLTMFILLIEAILYRKMQFKLDRLQWVWTHIASLYIIVLVIPVLTILFNLYVVDLIKNGDVFEWARKANIIRNILFWSTLIIGHFFFVLTIVRAFSKKEGPEETNHEPPDLLDEFPT